MYPIMRTQDLKVSDPAKRNGTSSFAPLSSRKDREASHLCRRTYRRRNHAECLLKFSCNSLKRSSTFVEGAVSVPRRRTKVSVDPYNTYFEKFFKTRTLVTWDPIGFLFIFQGKCTQLHGEPKCERTLVSF